MGAVGISFLKKNKNRELVDFFTTVEEDDGYAEMNDADLEQYDELSYIN